MKNNDSSHIRQKQIIAGENAVVESLRERGLLPDSDDPHNMMAFSGQWEDARTNPPKETGMYLCVVKDVNDISTHEFQWVCGYHHSDGESRWSDQGKNINVKLWAKLPSRPH